MSSSSSMLLEFVITDVNNFRQLIHNLKEGVHYVSMTIHLVSKKLCLICYSQTDLHYAISYEIPTNWIKWNNTSAASGSGSLLNHDECTVITSTLLLDLFLKLVMKHSSSSFLTCRIYKKDLTNEQFIEFEVSKTKDVSETTTTTTPTTTMSSTDNTNNNNISDVNLDCHLEKYFIAFEGIQNDWGEDVLFCQLPIGNESRLYTVLTNEIHLIPKELIEDPTLCCRLRLKDYSDLSYFKKEAFPFSTLTKEIITDTKNAVQISFPSSEFHSLIREVSVISDVLNICLSNENKLSITTMSNLFMFKWETTPVKSDSPLFLDNRNQMNNKLQNNAICLYGGDSGSGSGIMFSFYYSIRSLRFIEGLMSNCKFVNISLALNSSNHAGKMVVQTVQMNGTIIESILFPVNSQSSQYYRNPFLCNYFENTFIQKRKYSDNNCEDFARKRQKMTKINENDLLIIH